MSIEVKYPTRPEPLVIRREGNYLIIEKAGTEYIRINAISTPNIREVVKAIFDRIIDEALDLVLAGVQMPKVLPMVNPIAKPEVTIATKEEAPEMPKPVEAKEEKKEKKVEEIERKLEETEGKA